MGLYRPNFRVLYVINYTTSSKKSTPPPVVAVVTIMSYANIIIRMRDCVRTNIYGQIESVLTRQEPLCPNPCAADSFPPEKKWIAYIMCDEVKNIYIHKCTSEHWEKYTTSSLSVVQNGLYCFAAVLNDKPTIWQVPAVCESFAKSVTRRQEDKRRNPKLGDCMKYASKPWMLI